MSNSGVEELDKSIYEEFYKLSFTGNAILTSSNHWVSISDKLCEILSIPIADIKKRNWLDFIHVDHIKFDKDMLDKVQRNEVREITFETRLIRGDGITIIALISLANIIIKPKNERYIGFQLTDITGKKQSEEILKRNEFSARRSLEELEWIYSNAPIGMCHLDMDLRYKRINKFLAGINGIPPNAHIGKTIQELLPRLADTANKVRQSIILNRKPFHQEFRRDNPKNPDQPRFFDENWYPLFDEHNTMIGFGAVVEEITEKKHVLALKAADRRKNELLATLAHELRNPIGSVGAALELMRMIDESQPEGARRDRVPLDRAERQVNHMKQLVEDILTVERITQGKIELKKERLDIVKTVNRAIEVIQSKLTAKSIKLKVNVPDRPLIANFDHMRFTQVIINLLDNATKFTERNGNVEITVKKETTNVNIIIRDDGIGIPSKNLSNIFEIFNQIQVSPDKKNEGIGIGLALVRNLVELHGGKVEARSDGAGRGSSFIVKIPQNS